MDEGSCLVKIVNGFVFYDNDYDGIYAGFLTNDSSFVPDEGVIYAIRGKHKDIVKFMFRKGALKLTSINIDPYKSLSNIIETSTSETIRGIFPPKDSVLLVGFLMRRNLFKLLKTICDDKYYNHNYRYYAVYARMLKNERMERYFYERLSFKERLIYYANIFFNKLVYPYRIF